jgi:cobalt-zinc-cadmium efflux system membrane fusion protein
MKKNLLYIAILAIFIGMGVWLTLGREVHTHDEHGHSEHAENEAHDEHGHEEHHDEHDEHEEEGGTEILPDVADAAGVEIAIVSRAAIDEHITLTGRISENRNTTVSVPARFPSIIKSVHASWGEKVKKGQKLAVLESRNNLTPYTITAPKGGVILERNISAGDLTDDEALFVIADLSNVWAEFHVFPRDLGRVQERQNVHVRAIEIEREDTAAISMILPTADAYSQTVVAIVTLPNTEGRWRPGMTVEGDVHLTGEGGDSLVVTEKAVQRMEDKTVVYIQKGDAYEARTVVLGKRDGHYVEVLEGLKEGERYVSEGSFIIKADIGKHGAGHDHAH